MDEVLAWNKKIAELDGFIFIVSEYNHSMPASLKNALDSAKKAWFNKVAGFVSYGSSNGARSVEHVRQVLTEVQVANVRTQVMFSLFEDFKGDKFSPRDIHQDNLNEMLNQLVLWSRALKPVREELK